MSFNKNRVLKNDIFTKPINEFFNVQKLQTEPNLSKLSSLDNEINQILNSNLNQRLKTRLYGETLRKYLLFKEKLSKPIIKVSDGITNTKTCVSPTKKRKRDTVQSPLSKQRKSSIKPKPAKKAKISENPEPVVTRSKKFLKWENY